MAWIGQTILSNEWMGEVLLSTSSLSSTLPDFDTKDAAFAYFRGLALAGSLEDMLATHLQALGATPSSVPDMLLEIDPEYVRTNLWVQGIA